MVAESDPKVGVHTVVLQAGVRYVTEAVYSLFSLSLSFLGQHCHLEPEGVYIYSRTRWAETFSVQGREHLLCPSQPLSRSWCAFNPLPLPQSE